MKKIRINPLIYFFILIIYLELIIKYTMTKHIFNSGLIYTIIFTIPIILLLTILTKSFPKIVNRVITIITMIITTIYYEIQYIFYNLFSIPFSFSSIGLTDQALDFTSIIKDAILSHILGFLLILMPLIAGLILIKHIDNSQYNKGSIISLCIMLIMSYFSTYLLLIPFNSNTKYANDLYYNIDDQIALIDKFGLLTYTRIDIKRQIVGYEPQLILDNEDSYEPSQPVPEVKEYGYNELNIDFASLTSSNQNIMSINSYMAKQNATNKSEYTGMFKGKNLIFILAEGFNEIAVDKDRTPTLYKLTNNGFVFNNFYSPVYFSTTGGEFQATTGLIPTQGVLSTWKKNQPIISYALGNAFADKDYNIQSYHDWTYTYYKRNLTMKTLGFNNYTGCGNGLEKRFDCSWLPYDSEMVEHTYQDYMGKDKNFVTYYVTVSGHSPYNSGDNIGRHYFEYVSDLEYSDPVKYYLAAQMELDRMLERLIEKLEQNNQLADTVIALVGDHYPYTLTIDEMNEAATYTKDDIIEVNRSNFILWNSEMEEPIIVDKVGSQIDVLPTLLNLFGIDYDSRLIIGKDILSTSEGVAVFSNRSWVSDYGSYFASSKKFVLKDGKELEDENAYIKSMNNKVANYYSISKMIIDTDYYSYVLKGE